MKAKLIIHGGAGLVESPHFTFEQYDESLRSIIQETYKVLLELGARAAVLHGIRLLEDDPIFNAGYGSRLQKDTEVRMSAAIMDSSNGKFSGVINIRNVQHPIDIANTLAKGRHHVLSGDQATEYARRKKYPHFDPIAPHRMQEHVAKLQGETGTVGVVALEASGIICVGTSTGGIGYETPGRVSDSATVAGTYASKFCGVSCTGKGEQIVDNAVAAKIATRVEDGVDLTDAVEKIMKRAKSQKVLMGLISIDKHGNMVVGNGHDTRVLFAMYDGKELKSFLNEKNSVVING
ncbi:MAG: asparaginase [Candidatus Melainabacteria bacterium]|nr:asparaginase [Candidatus Melainabacteria bacterium]